MTSKSEFPKSEAKFHQNNNLKKKQQSKISYVAPQIQT